MEKNNKELLALYVLVLAVLGLISIWIGLGIKTFGIAVIAGASVGILSHLASLWIGR